MATLREEKEQVRITLRDTIPPVLEKVIGKYIDITDFRPRDDNLKEFEHIVNMFDLKISDDYGFREMLVHICSDNNIKTVKYLREKYKGNECLKDSYYLSVDALMLLLKNNNDELFKLIVKMYEPNLVTYVFGYISLNEHTFYDIFANCSDDLLIFIIDYIVSKRRSEEFVNTLGNIYLKKMYSSLLERENSELLFYYIHKLSSSIGYSFILYMNNLSQDKLKSLMIRSFERNDFKLAEYIHGERYITGNITESKDSKLMDIFRQNCREGNSDIIEIMSRYILRKNINVFELIYIACMNQHLNVVTSLVESYRLKALKYTDKEENDIHIIYNKLIEQGYTEIAESFKTTFLRIIKKEYTSLGKPSWVV